MSYFLNIISISSISSFFEFAIICDELGEEVEEIFDIILTLDSELGGAELLSMDGVELLILVWLDVEAEADISVKPGEVDKVEDFFAEESTFGEDTEFDCNAGVDEDCIW